jgi:Pyruvate/2-oxoacid:ferredoxin oxidoreductase delta subunit
MGTMILIGAGTAVLIVLLVAERGLLPKRSTRSLFREHGFGNLLNLKALHAYVYLRWTRAYIAVAIKRLLPRSTEAQRRTWADGYHGKVLMPGHARSIITLNERIDLRDLEQIIPYPAARSLVLDGPPEVVAYECVCRSARRDPCRPTQVCMVIGKPFTDFTLEHHPKTSHRLERNEALDLLKQEHERGHVHVAWFKDVMLERFYAICNCCTCCCGGMEGMLRYQMPSVAPSGHAAVVDVEFCTGCGACAKSCPFHAIAIEGTAKVEWARCMGCGVCGTKCPSHAIALVRDRGKGIPFDVRALGRQGERS